MRSCGRRRARSTTSTKAGGGEAPRRPCCALAGTGAGEGGRSWQEARGAFLAPRAAPPRPHRVDRGRLPHEHSSQTCGGGRLSARRLQGRMPRDERCRGERPSGARSASASSGGRRRNLFKNGGGGSPAGPVAPYWRSRGASFLVGLAAGRCVGGSSVSQVNVVHLVWNLFRIWGRGVCNFFFFKYFS